MVDFSSLDLPDAAVTRIRAAILMIDAARRDRKLKYIECYRNLFDAIAKEILDVHGHDVNQFLESLPDLIFDIAVEQTWIRLETNTTGPRVVGWFDIGNRSSGDYWAFRQSDRYAWGRDTRPSPIPAPARKVMLGHHEVAEEVANWFRSCLAGRINHSRGEALLLTIPQASVTAEELAAPVPVPGETAPPGPQAPCPAEELGDSLNGESLDDDPLADTPRFAKRSECVFRREGEVWRLTFEGKTVHIGHLLGMTFIAELLRRARMDIDSAALGTLVGESTIATTEMLAIDGEMVSGPGGRGRRRTSNSALATPGTPVADAKAIRTVKQALADRQAELACASEIDDSTRKKLEEEVSKLKHYLTETEGYKRRPRIEGGVVQRSRSRVQHAITRAIDRIGTSHPSLGTHLEHSIRTGTSNIYSPVVLPDWTF